jgi:hypothetical protein
MMPDYAAAHESFRMAVMFHGVALLPKLRALTRDQLHETIGSASRYMVERPLFCVPHVNTREHVLPHLPAPMSGAQVVAAAVFGLYVALGENDELAGPLVENWPVREALAIAGPRNVAA